MTFEPKHSKLLMLQKTPVGAAFREIIEHVLLPQIRRHAAHMRWRKRNKINAANKSMVKATKKFKKLVATEGIGLGRAMYAGKRFKCV